MANTFSSEDILAKFNAKKEEMVAKQQEGGKSLPMAELLYAIDMVFDALETVETFKSPVKVLVDLTYDLLKEEYGKFPTGKKQVTAKVGRDTVTMTQTELKELRLRQLEFMKTNKQDNLYRRISGLGYRKYGNRFDIEKGGILVRTQKPTSSMVVE